MVQQINLFTPLLLQPRSHFTARALLQALGAVALGLAAVCGWVVWQTARLEADEAEARLRSQQEQRSLEAALADARVQHDPVALQRQLLALQTEIQGLTQRRQAQQARYLPPGQHHSETLAMLARTLPAPAWLTQLQLGPERLSASGWTQDPAALQDWVERLRAQQAWTHPAGLQLRVTQWEPRADSRETGAPPAGRGPVWAFTLSADRRAEPPPFARSAP